MSLSPPAEAVERVGQLVLESSVGLARPPVLPVVVAVVAPMAGLQLPGFRHLHYQEPTVAMAIPVLVTVQDQLARHPQMGPMARLAVVAEAALVTPPPQRAKLVLAIKVDLSAMPRIGSRPLTALTLERVAAVEVEGISAAT